MTCFLSILSLASILFVASDFCSNLTQISYMVNDMSFKQRRSLVWRESGINFFVMLLSFLAAKALIYLLNFSELTTYLGCGLSIFLIGIRTIIFKKEVNTKKFDQNFFRMTALSLPFLTGPSWFALMMILHFSTAPYLVLVSSILLASSLVSLTTVVFFAYSFDRLKSRGFAVLENIFSLIALIIGAEKFITGLKLIINKV